MNTASANRSRFLRMGAAALGVVVVSAALSSSNVSVSARPSVQLGASNTAIPSAAAPIGVGGSSKASVSGDGRYVVYQASPGLGDPAAAAGDPRTSTVYLTDRVDDTTVELTTVPDGLRSGNSVNAVIAGDGCSVVVVTELALDVFRDDDTADRWDVYRLRLEQCGGVAGGWELVSTRTDGSSLARDDVDIDDPPAVSRSGTLIAYTHPATQLIESAGVDTVSLVDLGRPIADPGRSIPVAGMPLSTPDTQFVHAGLDQPAISGDGRFVAYRSDAASTEAVPGWGTGATPGGPATRQVFVWDRNEPDPFRAVALVSQRVDGEPTAVGASDPVLSRDGRVVAFVSSDVGLVPAVLPPCGDGCPSQVFRLDRDTDGNGLYDEVGRVSMTMASSVAASEPVVAGTSASNQPAMSADGQLVAFVTRATNLQLIEASGGGEPNDGDLLVADARLGTLRRVTVTGDGIQPAVAAHAHPQLSDTGRTTVFDTLAAPQLILGGAPGRQVVTMTSEPTLSLAEADLGTTLVGFTSDEWYVAVNNVGPTTFTPSKVTVSDGRFAINQEASSCSLDAPVPPGGDCIVRLTFTPNAPGPVSATLTVAEDGFEAVSISAVVRGAGGSPVLRPEPAGKNLGQVVVGSSSGEIKFDVENVSLAPTAIQTIDVRGAHPDDFVVTSQNCQRRALNPQATCSIGVTFTPTGPGLRTALVQITTSTGEYTTILPDGFAVYEPSLQLDVADVTAGNDLLVGGSGFPPDAPLSIFFADDPAQRLETTTNGDGTILRFLPIDELERGGQRTLVARTADGTSESITIEIVEMPAADVAVPGFGYGF
jgi:hypothetical protein